MAHSSTYYNDMADIDAQIAMVQMMDAASKNGGTPEEKNEAQIQELKAKKSGIQADLEKAKIKSRETIQSLNQIGNVANGLRDSAYGVNRALANVPTPGGVGVPIFILLFLYFILFPVGGHTRMFWLFLVLVGHATIGITSRGSNAFWESAGQTSNQSNQNSSQNITGTFTPGTDPFNQHQTGLININKGSPAQLATGIGNTLNLSNNITGNILGFNALEIING